MRFRRGLVLAVWLLPSVVALAADNKVLHSNFEGTDDGWYFNPVSSGTYSFFTPVAPPVVCVGGASYPPTHCGRPGCEIAWFSDQPWWNEHFIESRGQWWVDSNHFWDPEGQDPPGFGYLNILAFRQVPYPVDLTNAIVTFRLKKSSDFAPQLVEYLDDQSTGVAGTEQGHLYFWFETASTRAKDDDQCNENTEHPFPPAGPGPGDSCKNHDYILRSLPLETQVVTSSDAWFDVTVTMNPLADWQCLGANRANQGRYGCLADMTRALQRVHALGFIVAPVRPDAADQTSCPDSPSNCGAVSIDDVFVARPTEPVVWTSNVGVQISGNSLSKPEGSDAWNAGAVSSQLLVRGDGYVEFKASETDTYRVIGLENENPGQTGEEIDFAIYLSNDGSAYAYESGQVRAATPYLTDDIFRIGIESGVVKYRKNGAVFYASKLSLIYPLVVDTSLFSVGSTISDVVIAGFGDLARWTDRVGVEPYGPKLNGIRKPTDEVAGWNAAASSAQVLVSGDGFVEFTATDAGRGYRVLGLGSVETDPAWEEMSCAIYLSEGSVYIFEHGTFVLSAGGYEDGDRFRIAIEGGRVRYRRNGILLYTSGTRPASPLLVRTSVYSPGLGFDDVVLSGALAEKVAWTNMVNVAQSPTVNSLTKIGGSTAWDAGASSAQGIVAGDGFVDFAADTQTTTDRTCGLNHGDSGQTEDDVDFGIRLSATDGSGAPDPTVYVVEGGVSRDPAGFGGFAPGDRFRVAVESGTVRYRRNGVLLYESTRAPTYPLVVDTALRDVGAELSDVYVSGTFAIAPAPSPTPSPSPSPPPPPPPVDFNTDGDSDILWRNQASGENYAWFMDGATQIGGAYLTTVTDVDWRIAGLGDFNGDGKIDLLWRHQTSGANYVWLMDGTSPVGGGYLPAVADIGWRIVGVGDFNGDGKPDILWRHETSGQNYAWFMDGMTQIGGGAVTTVADSDWRIVGVGDFNADGQTDILWRHRVSGQNRVWFMHGTSFVDTAYLTPVGDNGWKIVGVPDLDGDGKPDILWRRDTGEDYVWFMDGTAMAGGAYLPAVPDPSWKVVPADF